LEAIKGTVKNEEERVIVRFIESNEGEEKDDNLKNDKIEKLSKRLEQLKAFEDISSKLRKEVETQIQTLNE